MPRFESNAEFWEIERDGAVLRFAVGRIGEPPDRSVHTMLSEDEAMLEFDRQVAEHTLNGFRPVDQPRDEIGDLEPGLAAAVIEALAPERLDSEAGLEALRQAWAVLGDWLSARGDVRGELISIDENLGYVDGRGAQRLYARRDMLLRQWIPRWFGDYAKLDAPDKPIYLAWDHGFIAAARIGTQPGALDLSRWRLGLRDLVPVLATVLAHPLVFALQQLRIAELDPHGKRDLTKALPLLRDRSLRALIRLELGGIARGRWVRDEYGNMRQREALARIGWLHHLANPELWAPRLAALRIIGRELRMFPQLPQLRVVELIVPSVDEELCAWLIGGPWPNLERLWLRCTNVEDPWAGSGAELFDELIDVLRRSPLRELGVQGNTALEHLAWAALNGPLPIEELRVFGLTEAQVPALMTAADYLDHVPRIVLEDCQVVKTWHILERRFGVRLFRLEDTFGVADERGGSHLYESLFDAPGWKG